MRGLTKARWLVAAITSMRRSNAEAARILRAHGIAGCTDVTGFGLLGHLSEMLRASDVGANLQADNVLALPGALELARAGVESTLAPENRRLLPQDMRGPLLDLLIDPQTSGGLLAGVASARASACLGCIGRGRAQAAIIGIVREPGAEPAIRIA